MSSFGEESGKLKTTSVPQSGAGHFNFTGYLGLFCNQASSSDRK